MKKNSNIKMDTIIIKSKKNNTIKNIELSIFDNVFINMKFKYEFYGLLDLNKIKKSLEDTLNIYPFIGGKMVNHDNFYFIDITNPIIKLIIDPEDNINISADNEFLFIVVFKKYKNITILELYINHIIGDGKTINDILKTWSDIYQNKYIENNIIMERYKPISIYKNITDIKKDKYLNLYKIFNFQDIDFMINSPPLDKCIIEFNKQEIEILKNISKSYSSLDALSSYLFNICSDIEKNKKLEYICTSIDFRKRINIDLNTLGNYVILANTDKINNENNNKNLKLRNVSKYIRKSINNIDNNMIDKCSTNIEYHRRLGKFEEYTYNIRDNYFITDSWTTFDINNINFGLIVKDFIPPFVSIPYLTLYMKSNENIIVNILIPDKLKNVFKDIIIKDKKEKFKDYY